jgi:oligo-alginate lyase
MKKLLTIALVIITFQTNAQHPVTFFTKPEAMEVKNSLQKYPLLLHTYTDIKRQTDEWLDKTVDVPVPKDPAGGYTHERHKANYTLMFNSGILYNLTGNVKYATLVKNILLQYAKLNPTLQKHPQATSSSPGHIFWQALNDANWMVYTGMAYDLIYNSLTTAERTTIEHGAFKPEVDFFTKDLNTWFNLIHNHGVWACAGVGIIGIATNNKEYTDMALYGTQKDGKSGFIAQMNNLFSPDGYYTEGPYYVRYAILPYYLFANALQHARPELKIFEQRDRILQKALITGLQQTNTDGTFFPLNDALKDKDYTTNEMITAIDIAYAVYGADAGLLTVAKKQDRVLLHKGGVAIASAIAGGKNISSFYPYRSVEYVDGAKGDEGGVSLLRGGKDTDLTTLIYKYTSHGLSHGHFDKLNINFYDKGSEVLTDYGSVRFVNVEQKYGGRYLPENETYASQTIAHNTVVVDEASHFYGNEKTSEQHHPTKLFSNINGKAVQVTAARADDTYTGVQLQRAVYLLQLPGNKKMVADIFNVSSATDHQYDLPFHYNGQVINSSFKYQAALQQMETLGKKNGYQFLWKEAEANANGALSQFTFLHNRTYYTVSSATDSTTKLFLVRAGANDPNFNLRREPAYIIRKKGASTAFINIIEVHGKFDPVTESSVNSYPSVRQIQLLQNDKQLTIASIILDGKQLLIAQCNSDMEAKAVHLFKRDSINIEWTGPYVVLYDGKRLQ